jgi:Homeodomain-like domain
VDLLGGCPSPISRLGRKSLTFARRLARLQAMRETFRTIAALRSGLSTRRDLFFGNLAHATNSPSWLVPMDASARVTRLLWQCLRRVWSQWRERPVLVQPATVARWHREGFRGCWSRRSRRRPGRPRIDSQMRALIRRMATENCLWGALRIHGELLKLGITVSERTVSRYLPDRLTAPSQTWKTFFAKHIGLAFISTVASSYASRAEDVVEAMLKTVEGRSWWG